MQNNATKRRPRVAPRVNETNVYIRKDLWDRGKDAIRYNYSWGAPE